MHIVVLEEVGLPQEKLKYWLEIDIKVNSPYHRRIFLINSLCGLCNVIVQEHIMVYSRVRYIYA